MTLTGRSIIGSQLAEPRGKAFHAVNPATGQSLEPAYYSASDADVNQAAAAAARAFEVYSRATGKAKAAFLRKIAEKIEALGDDLVNRAVAETALPPARIKTEIGRTCFQLRIFAQLVEEGSWVSARIDRPDPHRTPIPKPDMRSLERPLGPVAVFCASNFPLAYSVAGGDTASALAAGNPVVVKGHNAHPGTAEMVGHAVRDAVRDCGLPEGVFSLVFDSGIEVGVALVNHPEIKAVGFTGSRQGGRALMNAAAARPVPIPVYAEMSSVNPFFILPGAMKERGAEIAKGLHTSVTVGAGQFCTKPGVIIPASDVENSAPVREFVSSFGELMKAPADFTLLTERIHSAYFDGVRARGAKQGISSLAQNSPEQNAAGFRVGTSLFETEASSFLGDSTLQDEIFGPSTLLVRHSSREQLFEIARNLEGHLTATIHGTEEDLREYADLVALLESKVGRLIFNGYPTGLEVGHATVHGGPYPATSDGRTTSVGTQAIHRFARLVCYQNFPDAALPGELQNDNPLGIWRLIDGQMTRDAVSSVPKVQAKST